jgi:hypothetical protein
MPFFALDNAFRFIEGMTNRKARATIKTTTDSLRE